MYFFHWETDKDYTTNFNARAVSAFLQTNLRVRVLHVGHAKPYHIFKRCDGKNKLSFSLMPVFAGTLEEVAPTRGHLSAGNPASAVEVDVPLKRRLWH